jgi:hypothetical protein
MALNAGYLHGDWLIQCQSTCAVDRSRGATAEFMLNVAIANPRIDQRIVINAGMAFRVHDC